MLTVLSICSSWIYLELIEHWYQKVNLIWSSSVAASAPHFHTPWSCPPSSWQQIQIKKKLSMLSLQGFKCHRSFKRHLLCAGGSRNRSARRQRALLSSSQVRQRVLNVCVLTSLNLTFLWRRKQMNGISVSRSEVKNKKQSAAYLLFFYAPLQCFYVVLYSHVDESVLCLSLHHPRTLRTNHLYGLRHINVTVHSCTRKNNK